MFMADLQKNKEERKKRKRDNSNAFKRNELMW